MRVFLEKIVSIGIEKAQKKERKKIKILNGLCLFLIVIISFIITKGVLINTPLHQNFNFLGSHTWLLLLAILIIYLQHIAKIQFARVLFVLTCIIYACIFSFLEPGTLVEQNFIIIPIISLTLINNKWINISVLIACFFLHYFYFKTIENYTSINYQTLQMFAHLAGNFLIFMHTQNLNKKQEKMLEKQRDKEFYDKIILEEQEAKLRELNEFKSHFFVNLSHEIRTPITLIKGYSHNLNLNDDKDINQDKIQIINSQINQIEGILNNILDLSKLDANKLHLDRGSHNITPLLNKLYADYKALFDKKYIRFTLKTVTQNIQVDMDVHLIEKAMHNLLNNALKFTPKNGAVTIYTLLNDNFSIGIYNTGIGIPKDDIKKIFERFYQTKNHITKSQGSGIGLSFTKNIIEAHGFSIDVESKPNINTTFTITIPKKYTNVISSLKEEELDIKTTKEIQHKKLQKPIHKNTKTILIVDDHEQMRNYLSNILTNYNVLKAENGEEALAMINTTSIDLLITDYMMPIMDGEALVKVVKKIDLKIPIIVLTARIDESAKLNMLRVGVDGYLHKPFVEEELLLHVKNSLQLYKNIVEEQQKLTPDEKEVINKHAIAFNNTVVDFILKNVEDSNFSVKTVADHLHISQSTLNRRTKSIFGLTAQAFILQIRLEKAKELAIDKPYLTKQEISYKVGIVNASYLFKKLEENYGEKFLNKIE